MSVWKFIRLAVIASTSVLNLFTPAPQLTDHLISWSAVLFVALLFPAIFFLAAILLTIIRGPKLDVHQPDWDHNLFDASHGEHFFHLGAIVLVVSGSINAFRSLIAFGQIPPIQVAPIALGIGTWVGIHGLAKLSRWQSQNAT